MKKISILLLSVSVALFVNGQKNSKLYVEFGAKHRENLNKLSSFLNKNTARNADAGQLQEYGKNLASVVNGIPVFWQAEDARANNASNLTLLHNGAISGMNGTIVDGAGINILMFDTGKILNTHQEFGSNRITFKETDAIGFSSHSTSVAGMIGAKGTNATAKGVLPNATFENYSFSNTSKGTLYQKLESEATANISNHSYGINLGWFQVTTPSAGYPTAGWYWFGDYELNAEDTYSGSYHDEDADYDKIVYANPNHIVVKSTGNYFGTGPAASDQKYRIDNTTKSYIPFTSTEVIPAKNCSKGYNCIGWGALAKNVFTVQAVNQLSTTGNIYTSPSDITKYTFGSAGPRKDGAIKPDFLQ